MDKKKIKKIYSEKIKLIKNYNKSYFDKNEPIVSDKEYDDLRKNIIDLESEFDFLISKNSVEVERRKD